MKYGIDCLMIVIGDNNVIHKVAFYDKAPCSILEPIRQTILEPVSSENSVK